MSPYRQSTVNSDSPPSLFSKLKDKLSWKYTSIKEYFHRKDINWSDTFGIAFITFLALILSVVLPTAFILNLSRLDHANIDLQTSINLYASRTLRMPNIKCNALINPHTISVNGDTYYRCQYLYNHNTLVITNEYCNQYHCIFVHDQ